MQFYEKPFTGSGLFLRVFFMRIPFKDTYIPHVCVSSLNVFERFERFFAFYARICSQMARSFFIFVLQEKKRFRTLISIIVHILP